MSGAVVSLSCGRANNVGNYQLKGVFCHFDDLLPAIFVINNLKTIFIAAPGEKSQHFVFPRCTANKAF